MAAFPSDSRLDPGDERIAAVPFASVFRFRPQFERRLESMKAGVMLQCNRRMDLLWASVAYGVSNDYVAVSA